MLALLLLLLFAIPIRVATGRILQLRKSNRLRRNALLNALGVEETEKTRIVGFFHPYW